MSYPSEVLTKSKKGKIEVRQLLDQGKFAIYEYLDPGTGERSENKTKLVLLGRENTEYFIVPLKNGKRLMLPTQFKGKRKVWDGEKIVEL